MEKNFLQEWGSTLKKEFAPLRVNSFLEELKQ